jgi:hypothetical protein
MSPRNLPIYGINAKIKERIIPTIKTIIAFPKLRFSKFKIDVAICRRKTPIKKIIREYSS